MRRIQKTVQYRGDWQTPDLVWHSTKTLWPDTSWAKADLLAHKPESAIATRIVKIETTHDVVESA